MKGKGKYGMVHGSRAILWYKHATQSHLLSD